ncbi:hypothetical protein [Azohydromonas lata]|uniref:Uncharacterized protein n=1 Tax=Azohydromonas lata TaxID=45677 RepID=A0ABU5IJ52_9BURK|nr:hypothetical protein [Azohydromonas lata]MDZ5458673.1 hypothetical protein [Azohydromonas lata]
MIAFTDDDTAPGWLQEGLRALLGFAFKRRGVASLAPAHVAEMLVTSFAIPYLAVYWRFVGAWRFRVLFI